MEVKADWANKRIGNHGQRSYEIGVPIIGMAEIPEIHRIHVQRLGFENGARSSTNTPLWDDVKVDWATNSVAFVVTNINQGAELRAEVDARLAEVGPKIEAAEKARQDGINQAVQMAERRDAVRQKLADDIGD